MFSGKVVSPDDLVLRSSDQTASSARFPLNLIRTYNQIFNPRDVSSYYHLAMLAEQNPRNLESRKIDASPSGNILMLDSSSRTVKATGLDVRDWPVRRPSYGPQLPVHFEAEAGLRSPLGRDYSTTEHGSLLKRHRGEKKAIPEEQKDDKYFERRKRNNEAAKRSRDARKLREDRIAFRASILEQENAILKSQIFTLRDEIATLRQMIFPRNALSTTSTLSVTN